MQSYKENIPKFVRALEESGADPDGIFFNETLEDILYPKGHQGYKNALKNIPRKDTEGES